MNIAFDAKRAFHNTTGLGHYSRSLIRALAEYHPEHQYFLFNPKPASLFEIKAPNIHEVRPAGMFDTFFSSAWRSSRVKKDLKAKKIDLYHGLSHEIPIGMPSTGIRSVVTMHDLIHERYPDQYSAIDVKIYSKKFRYAAANADKVIAISVQTKKDLIEIYNTPEDKIVVCYQSCNPAFGVEIQEEEKAAVRQRYLLPDKFFLYVGSIIERKNLLNICKAIFLLRNDLDIPLVVIGNGGKYKQQVKDFIRQNGIEDRIIFLSESPAASAASFRNAEDFPAIYQSAIAMIYPSFFEGFGIPVLEALWSRLPVITSSVSSLPEVGGDAAWYVDPNSAQELAQGMRTIYGDKIVVEEMRDRGLVHAQKFTPKKCADHVMEVYNSL